MGDQSTPMMTLKRPRSVQFAKVEIIELPYTLGDNPSVSGGPPISASWFSQKRTCLDLEFFEQYRPPRRNKSALHLSKEARKELMLQNGHTETEIQVATIQAGKTRKQRLETIQELRDKVRSLLTAREVNPVFHSDKHQHKDVKETLSPMPKIRPLHQLPPSPIVPKKSPVRTTPGDTTKLPYLRFPSIAHQNGILSPRCQVRKRSVPIELGKDLFFHDDVLTPHVHSHTPKRICSPRHSVLSPRPENFCAAMRFPARIRSPKADSRPLIKPRRLASPQPVLLSHHHSPPPPRAS